MMKKNKLFGYVMTGVLSAGLIGGAGIHAFAAVDNTNTEAAVEQTSKGKWMDSLDEATKQKIQAIMEAEKAQLAELGITLPAKGEKGARGDLFANLDDETKEKATAIMDQLKDGTLTQEEAKTQLAELGVDLPAKGQKGARGDLFANLDDATKEKATAIMDQLKDGTLTQEEAKTQLAELGVDLPAKGEKGARGDIFANLDDETKEKATAIMDQVKDGSLTQEEAKTQLAELGVDLPAKGKKGARGDIFANVDDATKEKALAIMDETKAQLAELGVELPAKRGHSNKKAE